MKGHVKRPFLFDLKALLLVLLAVNFRVLTFQLFVAAHDRQSPNPDLSILSLKWAIFVVKPVNINLIGRGIVSSSESASN